MLNFSLKVCGSCDGLMQKGMNVNDAAIVSVKGNDYRIYFLYMIKNKTINIMKNSDLKEKLGTF